MIESSPTAFKLYIEEGINDGSIKAKYPKLTAELFLLICNVWMMPTIYPQASEEEAWQRFNMAKDIIDFLGLPVLDKALTSYADKEKRIK